MGHSAALAPHQPFARRAMPVGPERGFSLVEMAVTVAIAGVLMAVAAPALQEMIAGQRVRDAATNLYESVIYARSEAIKRADSVSIVTDDLEDGWNVEANIDGVATVIKTQGAFDHVSFDPADPGLTFNRLGRLAGSSVEVEISRDDTEYKRCVQVQSSGKPRVINGGCP